MNQSESPIVLLKSRDEVAKKLDDLINRGEFMRDELLKKPLSSSDELRNLVVDRNGHFHMWIRSIEQEFASSFSPAAKLGEWLRQLHHQQWQYHVPWQERAKALPTDINTHLDFLKDIRERVLHNYEEAPPDVTEVEFPQQLQQFMSKHFDKQELRLLCFDLGIEFENLKADSRDGLVVELIGYESRRDELPKLIERVKELRPQTAWDF